MNNPLGWLKGAKNVQLEEVEAPAKKAGGPARKDRNPNPALLAIRVFRDGSVFPSQALVDKFNLTYQNGVLGKDADGAVELTFPSGEGNGLDVIDSRLWGQYPKAMKEAGQNMLFVAPVPRVDDKGKATPKVDLFSGSKYDLTTGKPKADVMSQGSNTFGTDVLIPAIEDIFGIQFFRPAVVAREAVPATKDKAAVPAVEAVAERPGVEFVDLVVVESMGEGEEAFSLSETFTPKNPAILFTPKRILRGENKGKADCERRENVTLYGLIPFTTLYPNQASEKPSSDTTETVPGTPGEPSGTTNDVTDSQAERRLAAEV